MKTAIVFGPRLHNNIGGYGWIKHNICKALDSNFKVISVHMNPDGDTGTTKGREVYSSEERSDEPYKIEEIYVRNINDWSNLVKTIDPALVVTTGDPEKCWFVGIERGRWKSIYYYLCEARTINRYIPYNSEGERKYMDLKKIMKNFDKVIPVTGITLFALTEDLGLDYTDAPKVITPPVWKWNTSEEAAYDYRENLSLDMSCKMYYTIAINNVRKRLDQLLIYFRYKIMKKACDRLVIHTNQVVNDNGYDLVAIAARLNIAGNIILNHNTGRKVIEGLYSTGDVFISTPAAEGYGLPFHESLLLGKKCIHTSVGEPYESAKKIKGSVIEIIEANAPYFHTVGNQSWYTMDSNPKIKRYGKKGNHFLKDIINTPEQYQNKFLEEVNTILPL